MVAQAYAEVNRCSGEYSKVTPSSKVVGDILGWWPAHTRRG